MCYPVALVFCHRPVRALPAAAGVSGDDPVWRSVISVIRSRLNVSHEARSIVVDRREG
jgi:hypothetical protein